LFLLHLCFDNSKDVLFFSQFIVPLLWSFGGAVRVDHAQEEENSVMADSAADMLRQGGELLLWREL
jgi:hypothetical protein